MTNCTVSGNSAGGDGGGLYSGGTTSLTNCTISDNYASVGGGLLNNDFHGTVTLGNTIIAGNMATNTGPDVSGAVDSSGNNLIGEVDGSSGWVSSDLIGTIADPCNARSALARR